MKLQNSYRGIDCFDRAGLQEVCIQAGQASFRSKQLEEWLYKKGVHSYQEMTNLSQSFRDYLSREHPLNFPEIVTRLVSRDGTRKYVLRFYDGTLIETVGLPADGRLTVCFSTQAGCAMNCSFCATGQGGLTRSLTPGEMVWQLILVQNDFGERVSNAVAMGQGEPFANYDATLAALDFINAPTGLGIGARHITVSTCGLIPQIQRFSELEQQYTLAISLHSAVQATRDKIMPGVRSFDVKSLRQACISYASHTGRRPTYEYALMSDINDTEEELNALVDFCAGTLCHVNLIPVNPTALPVHAPKNNTLNHFKDVLTQHGIETSIRTTRGADIKGACGQLKQSLEK